MKKSRTSISKILRGEFFSKEQNYKYFPLLLFLVFLILLNIAISFRAERILKETANLENEITSLRLRYITTKSDLMHFNRRSTIESIVKKYNLETSLEPPLIIEKNND